MSQGSLVEIQHQLLGKFVDVNSRKHIGKFKGKYVLTERSTEDIERQKKRRD